MASKLQLRYTMGMECNVPFENTLSITLYNYNYVSL